MTCEFPASLESFADWLVWPTECDYYIYLKIMAGLMVIISWGLYKAEERRVGSGDLISALGVSSIAMVVLAVIGTLIKSSGEIAMIQLPILLYALAVAIPLILIWIFKD